jgi:hypothetical protein
MHIDATPFPISPATDVDNATCRLLAALDDYGPLDTALRPAVCAYVRRARLQGAPCERVVLTLLHLVEARAAHRARPRELTALQERVVRWTIREWYGEYFREAVRAD